jgi:hypothetical protein
MVTRTSVVATLTFKYFVSSSIPFSITAKMSFSTCTRLVLLIDWLIAPFESIDTLVQLIARHATSCVALKRDEDSGVCTLGQMTRSAGWEGMVQQTGRVQLCTDWILYKYS